MAATIIDTEERQDDDTQFDSLEPVEEVQEAPVEAAQEETEEAIPDKYQGKSVAEIVRMHQEAEKLLGRQSSEVGELRKVVDSYIQTQLSNEAPEIEEEIDFYKGYHQPPTQEEYNRLVEEERRLERESGHL